MHTRIPVPEGLLVPRSELRSRLVIGVFALLLGQAATGAERVSAEQLADSRFAIRGSGYQPDWTFELDQAGRLRFMAQAGTSVAFTTTPLAAESARSGGLVYGARADEQELIAEVTAATCTDSRNGERFTHNVTIRVEGKEYRGCGRVTAP